MRKLLFLLLTVSCLSCSVEPEPLEYGKDACHHCKMVLMDTKFGAELVTAKGRVLKFDDVNCMISHLNAEVKDDRDVRFKLVSDFTGQGSLIDAHTAFYLKSSEIKSPMASEVAAFENYDVMGTYKKDLNGIYLTWGELVTQFK